MMRLFFLAIFILLAIAAMIAASFGLIGWLVLAALIIALMALGLFVCSKPDIRSYEIIRC